MPLQGWTESLTMISDGGRILTYEKGDQSAVLTIDQEGSTTRIAPALTGASALPAELVAIPSPAGFGVIEGSTQRMAEGGKFRMATARLFGTAGVEQAAGSYRQALASQWDLNAAINSEDAHPFTYTSKTNSGLTLSINIEKVDAGTEIALLLLATNEVTVRPRRRTRGGSAPPRWRLPARRGGVRGP
jgi:hypothetical protein